MYQGMYQEINYLPERFSNSYDRIENFIIRKNNRVFTDAYNFCYDLLHYAISQKRPEILDQSHDFESLISNKKVLEILKENMGLQDTKPFSELIYLNKKYSSKKTEVGLFIEADAITAVEVIEYTLKIVFHFKGIEYNEIDLYPYVINLLTANQENTNIVYGNSNNKVVKAKSTNKDNLAKLEEKSEKARQREIDDIDKKLNFATSKDAKISRDEKKKYGKLAEFALRYDIDYDKLIMKNIDLSNETEVIKVLKELASTEALQEYIESTNKDKKGNKAKSVGANSNLEANSGNTALSNDKPSRKDVKAAKKAEKIARKNSKKGKISRELNEELLNLVDDINNNSKNDSSSEDDYLKELEKRIDKIIVDEDDSDFDLSHFDDEDIKSIDELENSFNETRLKGKDYLTNMLEKELSSNTKQSNTGRKSFVDDQYDDLRDSLSNVSDNSNTNTSEKLSDDNIGNDSTTNNKYHDDSVFGESNFLLNNAKKFDSVENLDNDLKNKEYTTQSNYDSTNAKKINSEQKDGVVIDTSLFDDVVMADREFSSTNTQTRERIQNYLNELGENNISVNSDFNVILDNIQIDDENTLTSAEFEKIRNSSSLKDYNKELNDNLSITLFNSSYLKNEVFHIYNLKNNIDPASKYRSSYAILYNALQKSHLVTASTYIKSRDLDDKQLSEVYKYQMLILTLIKNGTLNDYNWNINMLHGSTLLMSYAVKDILNSVSHISKFMGESFVTPKIEIKAKNEVKLLYVNVSFNVKLIDRDVYAILNTKFKSGEDFVVYNKWIEKPVKYLFQENGFTHQQINSLRLLAYDLLGSYSLSENQINYIIASLDPTFGNVVAIDDYKKNKPLALFTIAVLQPKISIIVVKDFETSYKYERLLKDFYSYTSVSNLADVRSYNIYDQIENVVNNKPQIILATSETFQIYEFKRLVKKLDDSKMIWSITVDNAEEIPQRGHTSKVSLLLLSDTLDKVCPNAKRIAIADVLYKNIAVDLISEFKISDPSEIITVEKYDHDGKAVFVSAVYDLNREIDPLRKTHNQKEIEILYRKELNHITKLYKELSNKSGKVKIVCNSETKIGNERALYILHKLGIVATWELSFDGDKTVLSVVSNPNIHSFYYIKKSIEEYINSYTKEDEILLSLKSCASMGELITLFYEWYVYTFINPDLKTVRMKMFDGTLEQSKLAEGNPIKHQVTVLEQKFRELSDGNYNMSFDGFTLNDVIKLASSLDDSLLEDKKHEVEIMLGIIIRKLTVYHSIISLRLGEFDESNARDGLIYALNTLDASDLRAVYRDLAYLYEKLPTAQKIAMIDVLLEVDKDALYKLINVFKNDKVIYSFIVKHISSKINL